MDGEWKLSRYPASSFRRRGIWTEAETDKNCQNSQRDTQAHPNHIIIFKMGNSQTSIKSKFKDLFSRKEEQPSIKQNRVCPKCSVAFPGISPDFYTHHVQSCKGSLAEPEQTIKPAEESLQPEHIKTSKETVQHVFQKIPTNTQKTEFKWVRVTVIEPNVPALMSMTPQAISKLSFQQKHAWMRATLQRLRIPWQYGADIMKVQKDNVLMTSISAASKVNMHKEVKVQFADDKVHDAGGLLREWMHMIIKEMFSETGVFEKANTSEVMYKIKWDKDIDVQFATSLFSLFGTILGKAIFERIPLTCYLDRTIIRHLCGQSITLDDISGYDKDFYKNWKYVWANKIEPFGQYFCVLKQHGDHTIQTIQLVPGGQKIELNESNKHLFIRRCIDFYCTQTISEYIKVIQKSLYKVVPQKLLSVFEPHEMEMILYGVPFVNVDDWRMNTEYKGAYYKNHQIIKWFWTAVSKMTQQQLCNLLHFITGSSRIPIYGFQKLQSNRGNYAKFLIQSVPFSQANPYPKAHTCFNRLELPMYPKEEMLNTYLFAIVNNNLDGVYGLD